MGASFRELLVWQRAMQLCVAIYKLTAAFPESERFGLTNQLRRASVSIASNIAEGYGRSTTGEYVQFLGHSRGSLCEVQTQLALSEALKMGNGELRKAAEGLTADVSRLLNPLIKRLRG